jgi:hypothetical protein
MLTLPKSLEIIRNKTAEANLVEKTRTWLEADSKDRSGIHASDLLDPRKAYFDKTQPKQPLSERMVGLFFVGKVLHVFFLSALHGTTGADWKSDGGSTVSKKLGFSFSPDWVKDGIPGELKTSRGKYEMRNSDLSLYLEQELIYQVGLKSTKGRLVVLLTNLPAPPGQGFGTFPQFRAYNISVSKSDLLTYEKQLVKTRKALELALKTKKDKDIRALPLCREFKCSRSACPHFSVCAPEGRIGVKRWER